MRRLGIAVAAALVMAALQAQAQTVLTPPAGTPMTLAEFQGVSCAGLGTVVGLGALAYIDPLAIAAGSMSLPWLLVPVAAAGFAVGCSVGATLGPAFLWLHRQVR